MADASAGRLSDAILTASVLDNLERAPESRPYIEETLQTALIAALAPALGAAGGEDLAGLASSLGPIDFAANRGVSPRDLIGPRAAAMAQGRPVPEPPLLAALPGLPGQSLAELLQLDLPLLDHPSFRREARLAALRAILAGSRAPANNPDLIERFIGAYAEQEGIGKTFWDAIAATPEFADAGVLPALQMAVQIADLTGYNPAMALAVLAAIPEGGSLRNLAKLTQADWHEIVAKAIPREAAQPAGATAAAADEALIASRASRMIGSLRAALPTAFIAAAAARSPEHQDVARFLEDSPEFDFATTRIRSFVAEKGEAALAGVQQPEQLANQLQAMQRVFRVTPEFDPMNTMLTAGLDSAHKIASVAPAAFAGQFGPALGGSQAALAVHTRARLIAGAATEVFTQLATTINGAVPAALGPAPNVLKDYPNLAELFGPVELCDCENCRSVHSQAAYFVDLLQMLSSSAPGGHPPLAALLARRPDLEFLKLSCENAETQLPYVDIVNEILESFVVLGKLDQSVAKDSAGNTTQELQAEPRYTLPDAYDQLRQAVFPLAMPFHQPLAQIRPLLAQVGAGRYEVMRAFRNGNRPSDNDLAVESLGISSEEAKVITGTAVNSLADFYYAPGNQPGDLVQTLASVPNFQDQTGLAYVDLVEMLKTRFVNPDKALTLDAPADADPCDLEQSTIKNLDENALRRMHRFLRLWRRTGVSMHELDRALVAANQPDINAAFLDRFARMRELSTILDVPLLQVTSLWADIDTAGDYSPYRQVFLSRAVVNPNDPSDTGRDFLPNPDGSVLTDPTKTLATHLPALQAALRMTANELLLVRVDAGLASNKAPLSLANVSVLYCYAWFSRALGLSVSDLITLKILAGPDFNPFSNPARAVAFARLVQQVQATSFSPALLSYIFRDVDSPAKPNAPAQAVLYNQGARLRDELRRIAANYQVTDDPTGEVTRSRLGELLPPEDVDRVQRVIERSAVFSAPYTSQANIVFPAGLAGRLSHDRGTDILSVTGPLTTAERDEVLARTRPPAVRNDPSFKEAVNALYGQPRTFVETRLVGFVTPADAIAHLLDEEPLRPGDPPPSLADKYAYLLAAASSALQTMQSAVLVKQSAADALKIAPDVLDALLPRLAAKNIMPAFLALAGAADDQDPQWPALYRDYARAATLLHKANLIVTGFKLDVAQLAYLLNHPGDFGGLDLQHLPTARNATTDGAGPVLIAQWRHLADYIELRDSLRGGAAGLIATFGAAELAAGLPADDPRRPAAAAALRQTVLRATGWDPATYDAVAGPQGFNLHVEAFKNDGALRTVAPALALAMRLGIAPARLFAWAVQAPDAAQAQDVKRAVRANFDQDSWLAVSEAVSDGLREAQRDALVAYLLPRLGLASANQLFEYFLIDVEMNACRDTLRITQAIASVQLFVQRCLMNLEPAVTPDMIDAELWEWMRHYRTWEANRKVFLYPENWLEPDLRRDRSQFFAELQTELLQSDMTSDAIENAFRHYLQKLDQVARLEVCGFYWELDTGPDARSIDVLHVVARTLAMPHIYFYRRLEDRQRWTPWERVNLEIVGDHVMPVMFNRRLLLLWPIFTPKTMAITTPVPSNSNSAPNRYWEITLAWSEYKGGRWLPKQVTSGPTGYIKSYPSGNTIKETTDEADIRRYSFDTAIVSDDFAPAGAHSTLPQRLVVNCRRGDPESIRTNPPTQTYVAVGSFALTAMGTVVAISRPNDEDRQTRAIVPGGTAAGMGFDVTDSSSFSLVVQGKGTERGSVPVILSQVPVNTPVHFRVLPPHQFNNADFNLWAPAPYTRQPFFYQDDWRTYFVTPVLPDEAVEKVMETRFVTFYLPYGWDFVRAINNGGVPALLDPEQQKPDDEGFVFHDQYLPTYRVPLGYPEETVDFEYGGPYACYNWELFFHIPMLIAGRLAKNQQFAEAQRWYHYIFNPTDPEPTMPPDRTPDEWARERYWKVLPFQLYEWDRISDVLSALQYTGNDPEMIAYRDQVRQQIKAWMYDPFNPHAIAALRQVAYQKSVLMKYLDNLIAWGDQLFSQYTPETINEATQLYVLASGILGPRPERVPERGKIAPETYNSIKGKLDEFSNVLVNLENEFPFSSSGGGPGPNGASTVLSVGRAGYFCIPQNDRLLGYWNTVEDRLFKIRHCQNIEGVVVQPVLEPAIEPGLLVRAAAAGVSIGAVLAGLNAPLPCYRFIYVLQRAQEMCAEVKALGAALLSALEKRDGEALALLRSGQEIALLAAARHVKVQQIEEARQTIEGLKKSRLVTETRFNYYKNIPERIEYEKEQVNQLEQAQDFQIAAQVTDIASSVAHMVPDFDIGVSGPFGTPVSKLKYGGTNVGNSLTAASRVLSFIASLHSHQANMASIQGGWSRRSDEWRLQANLAQRELDQIDQQIVTAELRREIAELDLKNHDLQVANAQAVDDYMRSKFTNQELYDWMVGQVSGIYFQAYQLAFDLARRAEQAFRFERGLATSNFVQFGYWDNLKRGLMAGEGLSLALHQLDKAYLDQNRREYEITRQVSLLLHDPLALVTLKETGHCYFALPEALFDMDYPGHYMRRMRTASLTIPAVVGPYTSINCTLTLLTNKVRTNPLVGNGYAEQDDDPRFLGNRAAVQSITTSHGQNDSGLFELSFRDERYLPFEGAGAISEWRIDLPRETNAFDFDTISDVILRINYTAREGGDALRQAAWSSAVLPAAHAQPALPKFALATDQPALTRLLVARHEFPDAWYRFLHPDEAAISQTLSLKLGQERFPFQYRAARIHIQQVELFLKLKSDTLTAAYANGGPLKITLTPPGGAGIAGTLPGAPAFLGGVPHVALDTGDQGIGTWALAAAEEDIANLAPELRTTVKAADGSDHARLNVEAIDDLYMIFYYATTR